MSESDDNDRFVFISTGEHGSLPEVFSPNGVMKVYLAKTSYGFSDFDPHNPSDLHRFQERFAGDLESQKRVSAAMARIQKEVPGYSGVLVLDPSQMTE